LEESNIKVTYETLFELLRREKNREELQKLDDTFHMDVIDFLKIKFEIATKPQQDLFSVTEKDKTVRELRNIQKLLKDLYERREKKTISMALNKSRTGSELIDTNNLLKEEQEFFNSLLGLLDLFRKGVLLNVLDGKLPMINKELKSEEEKPEVTEQPKEEKAEVTEQPEEQKPEVTEKPTEPLKEEPQIEAKEEFKSAEQMAIKKVKFILFKAILIVFFYSILCCR